MKPEALRTSVILVGLVLGTASPAFAADTASGTLNYKGSSLDLKYAWLVSGPSDMDPAKSVRRLILSATDIGAKMQACATLSCADGSMMEGMTVDFGDGPRLNYWITMNGQKVQYSGTAKPDTFSGASDAKRVAGALAINDTSAGGPKIDAKFDVTLSKEFKKAR